MEKYKNKIWADLKTDIEKAEFIRCGRAWETGIIAKAIVEDVADAYERCHRMKMVIDNGLGPDDFRE